MSEHKNDIQKMPEMFTPEYAELTDFDDEPLLTHDELVKQIRALRMQARRRARRYMAGTLMNVQLQKAEDALFQAESAIYTVPRHECADLTVDELRMLRYWRDRYNGEICWDEPHGNMPDELASRGYLKRYEADDYIPYYEFTDKAWAAVGRKYS